jgi:hypothetical protein
MKFVSVIWRPGTEETHKPSCNKVDLGKAATRPEGRFYHSPLQAKRKQELLRHPPWNLLTLHYRNDFGSCPAEQSHNTSGTRPLSGESV